MKLSMPGTSYSGPFEPLNREERKVERELKKHVDVLARKIGVRNVQNSRELERAADYIRRRFRRRGYTVRKQPFDVAGKTVENLDVEIPGTKRPEEIIVVGAHYDTVPGSPGANDNASGIAAVLEFARLFHKRKFARTIRLAAFVNEEPPFFQTGEMGSFVYAKKCKDAGEKVIAMMSMEMLGSFFDEPGSQRYPAGLQIFFPDAGNFIGFVGNLGSTSLVHEAIGLFREKVRFPSMGVALPEFVEGVGFSDHWSFWQFDYPALMVTDTAYFRYPHYHQPEDTPEKLQYPQMARVVTGMSEVIAAIADGVGSKK